jgi:H+-transporting ATPase
VGDNVLSTTVKGYKIVAFKPFDPVSKLTEATVMRKDSGMQFKVAKGNKKKEKKKRKKKIKFVKLITYLPLPSLLPPGAPQVIIRLCGGDAEASETVQEYGKRGMRCLGVARTEGEKWKLIGLLAFLDPPRPDSRQTIEETRSELKRERGATWY